MLLYKDLALIFHLVYVTIIFYSTHADVPYSCRTNVESSSYVSVVVIYGASLIRVRDVEAQKDY